MHARPALLTVFTAILGAMALTFPAQLAWYYQQVTPSPTLSVSAHAFLTYGLVLFTAANAYWIYQASPLVKWSLPLLSLMISVYYAYLYLVNVISNPAIVAGAFTVSLAINFFFVDEESKFILKHPHLRWWRIPARQKVKVSTFISPYKNEGFACETFDLSPNGAFIPYHCDAYREQLRPQDGRRLQLGESLSVRLTLGSLRCLRIKARVVRNSCEPLGSYPPGFAIQFSELTRKDKKLIQQYLKQSA